LSTGYGANAESSTPAYLQIDLTVTKLSEVFQSNHSVSFELGMSIDITYFGSMPPRWVVLSENTIPKGNLTMSGVIKSVQVVQFGNASWTRIGTDTWKPSYMITQPFQLEKPYLLTPPGDLNAWPTENFSFFLVAGASTDALNGSVYKAPSTLNIVNSHAQEQDVWYYSAEPTVVGNYTINAPSEKFGVQEFYFDISHSGTVVEGLSHVKILESSYLFLIGFLVLLTLLKAVGISLRRFVKPPIRLASSRANFFARVSKKYKSTTLAQLIVTVLLFVPFYELSVKPFVPPWVTFFDSMMSSLFFWFILLLFVALILVLVDTSE
jgi:hypothetical protein